MNTNRMNVHSFDSPQNTIPGIQYSVGERDQEVSKSMAMSYIINY